MEKTYTFYVSGMHCASCVLLTEAEVKEVSGVVSAKTSLAKGQIEIVGEFGDATKDEIARVLSLALEKHGYSVSSTLERNHVAPRWGEFGTAIPIALMILALYVLLQKLGLVNLIPSGEASYGTAVLIGVVASLSTCMAVVGGIVLTMASAYAKAGKSTRPLVLFHVARVLGFFLLGGVLGAAGSAFTVDDTAMLVMSVIIALVMTVVGIDLLDVFAWPRWFKLTMPKMITVRAMGVTRWQHGFAPIAIGIATFFLPCGFTQSMQLYALTTGSFMTGALVMGSFVLGTLPMLALVSFGSFRIERSANKSVLFKVAGLLVILFAVFNLLNALAAAGIIPSFFVL